MPEITIPKIGLILGTNRPRRIGGTIAEWTQNHLTSPAFETELIDLEKVGLPFLDEPDIPAHGHYTQAHTQAWSATIQQYAGFVLLFPQYNWGYPAVLKNALDYLYAEWAHKPVATIVYGSHGGMQAQLAMRFVTSGLHMIPLAVNPELITNDSMLNDTGDFIDVDQALAPSADDMRLLTTNLENFFTAHKPASSTVPQSNQQ